MVHEGKLLKQLIKENKFTQTQIAEKIGMNRSQFNILLNKSEIRKDIINGVCGILEIKPENFFENRIQKESRESLKFENDQLKKEVEELMQFKLTALQEQNDLLKQLGMQRDKIDQLREDKINLLEELNSLLKKLDIYKQLETQKELG